MIAVGYIAFLLPVALASPTLERHSAEFQEKVLTYGDIWTESEIEILRGFLDGLGSRGLGYISEALARYGNVLMNLITKLAQLDKRTSIALASLLGEEVDLTEDLLAKVEMLRKVGNNSSAAIKILNDMYSSGEIDGSSYLALLGHIIREFKLQHIDDSSTIDNLRKAVGEISMRLARPSYTEEPERGVGVSVPVALIKLSQAPKYLLAGVLLSLLAPVATQVSISLLLRSRNLRRFSTLKIYRHDLAPSSTSTSEDVVSTYMAAVNLLSRFYPIAPYETHREYLARIGRESKSKLMIELLSILTGEYERVRFGGQRPNLSGKQLIELLDRLEDELNSTATQ